jgi:hypothetical protein
MAPKMMQRKTKYLVGPHLGWFLMFLLHYVPTVLNKRKAARRTPNCVDLLWQDTIKGCQSFFIQRCHINCTGYSPQDDGTGADKKGPETIGSLMRFRFTIQ